MKALAIRSILIGAVLGFALCGGLIRVLAIRGLVGEPKPISEAKSSATAIIIDSNRNTWMLAEFSQRVGDLRDVSGLGVEVPPEPVSAIERITAPVLIVGVYAHGLRTGKWFGFTWHGSLSHELTFQEGRKSGPYKVYHPNGKVAVAGQYSQDVCVGIRTSWSPEGMKLSEGEVRDGKKTGKWVFWNEAGRIDDANTGLYEDDRFVRFLDVEEQ